MYELLFIIVIVLVLLNCVRMLPLDTWYIVERMGAYNKTWEETGVHYKLPLIDRIANKISKLKQTFNGNQHNVRSIDDKVFEIKPVFEITVIEPIQYTYTLGNLKKLEELIVLLTNEELRNTSSIDIYRNIYDYNNKINEKINEKINIEYKCINMSFLNLNIKEIYKN